MTNVKKPDHGLRTKKQLPDVIDPYDMEVKKKLNPLADDMNFIDRGFLVCGARKKKGKPGFCKALAGLGTSHKGYGRCKFCGGMNTGPITEEGKAIVSQNATKHGFYSRALRGKELEVYENLVAEKAVGLEHEIFVLKTKILVYLEGWRDRWEKIAQVEGAEAADDKTRVFFVTGENGLGTKGYYHAGTIEDKPLIRAMETLGRLVDKHAKLTQGNAQDILAQINSELRAASHGQVNISWGGKPQERVEKRPDN